MTMRAVLRSFGGVISFEPNHPKPKCGSDTLLVKVHAAAINPIDYKLRRPIAPAIVGIDFSGVVLEKGSKCSDDFNVGDEVYGHGGTNGAIAEYTVVTPDSIGHKPKSVSYVEAACMVVTYMTGLQALRDHGKLRPGLRVLIIGASGGCGTAAIQLAKALGAADIVAVCSGKNEEFVKGLGATEVVDYTSTTVVDYLKGEGAEVTEDKKFHVIYDAATGSGGGEDYKAMSLELLKAETSDQIHGQYVAINGSVGMWLRYATIGFRPNETLIVTSKNTADLEELAKLTDDGWTSPDGSKEYLKPVIAEEFSLSGENVDKAFTLLKNRRTRGKIVFKILE